MDRSTSDPLPPPSDAALALSNELAARIRAEIVASGGFIGFDRYMQRALYEPGLGYYSAGSAKLGAAGDYVTAPELSELFGRAVAHELAALLAPLSQPSILELGAGTGSLAHQVLSVLNEHELRGLPYRILEPSADLRERQHERLARFGAQVTWLERLPAEPCEGVILANEVADALPVARFVRRRREVRPLGVGVRGDALEWAEGPEQPELTAAVRALEAKLDRQLEEGYVSEICLMLPGWLRSLAAPLARGALLIIDYGLVRQEYYHPQRSGGTLLGHYRHRALDDPFFLPGLQDLSAWVDFSACADCALEARLEVAGFTTQANFLLEAAAAFGAQLWASRSPRELSAFKTLVLPGEMGERFKVLLLTRGLESARLPGRDLRHRFAGERKNRG